MLKNTIFFFILLFIISSCQQQAKVYTVPSAVIDVIKTAGDNSAELENLITHYKNLKDTTKLKAAYFLIENMEGQCYSTTKIVDTSGHVVSFDVLTYPNYKVMVAAWDSVENKIGEIDFERDTLIYDVGLITADYLINNIDLAVKAWEKPWASFLSFDEFCEYILPYRASNEPLEPWRSHFYKKYNWVQDSMKDIHNPTEACILINSEIISWFNFDPLFYRHPTDLGLSEMLDYKRGRCEDMTNLAIYSMRAQGVPVMSDYTPAWPNTGNNHAWNATLTQNREVVIFMGGDKNPYDYKLGNKKAKVYRKTFGRQKNSLAMTAPEGEEIPGWLKSSHYVDVTDEYITAVDLSYPLTKEKPDSVNYAYLSVFNSGTWKAIHWGVIENNTAVFTSMGKDIAYFPCFYKDGELIPAGDAFILEEDGSITNKNADTLHTISVDLYSTTRKVTKHATDEIEQASFKKGVEYELSYWNEEWLSIGTETAKGNMPLHFNDVPANALLWLVEKDSKKEERIFTVNEGIINWW